ncbi:hypothetical protein [Facilibium subflavum]|uniref:hypothetical protein n=1 Tax=Facilibium subflavum TaxID=2219058 RepID=UPI000E64FF6C|nr:hypothetical protein [Facilibium subflavum]
MMSLLSGKYGLMLFGAIGAVAVLTIIILLLKKYKQYKGKLKLPKGLKKKAAAPKRNIYKDIVYKIVKKANKTEGLASFFCVYEGTSEQMITYVKKFTDLEAAEVLVIDEGQMVIVEPMRVIFLISIQALPKMNHIAFNSMLTKVYKKGAIHLPIALFCLTENDIQPGQFALFQKILSQLEVYQNNAFELHIGIDFIYEKEKMRCFFELVKHQTKVVLSGQFTEQQLQERIGEAFAYIRNQISKRLITENGLKVSIVDAIEISESIERKLQSLSGVLTELTDGQFLPYLHATVINFGIHPANYYDTFFEQTSCTYKKSFKLRHAALPVLVVLSTAATGAFAYNLYQKYQLNQEIQQDKPFDHLQLDNVQEAQKVYDRWANMGAFGICGFLGCCLQSSSIGHFFNVSPSPILIK